MKTYLPVRYTQTDGFQAFHIMSIRKHLYPPACPATRQTMSFGLVPFASPIRIPARTYRSVRAGTGTYSCPN